MAENEKVALGVGAKCCGDCDLCRDESLAAPQVAATDEVDDLAAFEDDE